MSSHEGYGSRQPDDWLRQPDNTPGPEPTPEPLQPPINLDPDLDLFGDAEPEPYIPLTPPLPPVTPPFAAPAPAPANVAPSTPGAAPATAHRGLGRKMLSSFGFNFASNNEAREIGNDIVDEIKIAAAGVHRTYRAVHARRHERTERKKTEENDTIANILSSGHVKQTDVRYIRDQGISRKLSKEIAKRNLEDGEGSSMAQIRRYPNKKGRVYVPRAAGTGNVAGVGVSYLNPAANRRRFKQAGSQREANTLYATEVGTYGSTLAGQRRDARLHYARTGELLPIVESRPHYSGTPDKTVKGRPSFAIAHQAVFGTLEAPALEDMHAKERNVRKAIAHNDRERQEVPVYRNGARIIDPATGGFEMKTSTDAEIYLHDRFTRNERKLERAGDKAEAHRDAIDESRDADDTRIDRLTRRRLPATLRPTTTPSRTRNFVNRRANIAVRRFNPHYYGNNTNPRP